MKEESRATDAQVKECPCMQAARCTDTAAHACLIWCERRAPGVAGRDMA